MLFTLNEKWQTANVNKFHNGNFKTVKTEYGNFEFEFSAGLFSLSTLAPTEIKNCHNSNTTLYHWYNNKFEAELITSEVKDLSNSFYVYIWRIRAKKCTGKIYTGCRFLPFVKLDDYYSDPESTEGFYCLKFINENAGLALVTEDNQSFVWRRQNNIFFPERWARNNEESYSYFRNSPLSIDFSFPTLFETDGIFQCHFIVTWTALYNDMENFELPVYDKDYNWILKTLDIK